MKKRFGVKGRVFLLAGLLLIGATFVVGNIAWALPINPGFDLLMTPAGGGVIELGLYGTVNLIGNPIGPGGADTIVQRKNGLPASGTGVIEAEIVALSLMSVDPIQIQDSFFDVFVTLDPNYHSTGQLTIMSHDDSTGGGTFDSFFDVFTEISLQDRSGQLAPLSFSSQDRITATDTPWSHMPSPGYPDDPNYPAGNFYITAAGINHTGPHPHVEPARVPEPSTFLLFVSGLAGLVAYGRYGRKRATQA